MHRHFHALLCAIILIISMHKLPAASGQAPTTPSEKAEIMRLEANSGNYLKMLRSFDTVAENNLEQETAKRYLEQLKSSQGSSNNTKKDSASYDTHRARAHQSAQDAIQRAGGENVDDTTHLPIGALEAQRLLQPDRRERSLSTFINRNKGKVGMGVYQAIDSVMQRKKAYKIKHLSGTTLPEIADAFENSGAAEQYKVDPQSSMGDVFNIIRPATKIGFSIAPFARGISNTPWLGEHLDLHQDAGKLPKEHAAGKTLGMLNMTGLIADLIDDGLSKKHSKLTKEEMHALSYLNRRHGVASDITSTIKRVKTIATARFFTQIILQWGLPAALALFKGTRLAANDGTVFSTAMAAGNLAGLIDSGLSIAQRRAKRGLIKKIKKVTPIIKQELLLNPPTEEERAADKAVLDGDMDDSFSEDDETMQHEQNASGKN